MEARDGEKWFTTEPQLDDVRRVIRSVDPEGETILHERE